MRKKLLTNMRQLDLFYISLNANEVMSFDYGRFLMYKK